MESVVFNDPITANLDTEQFYMSGTMLDGRQFKFQRPRFYYDRDDLRAQIMAKGLKPNNAIKLFYDSGLISSGDKRKVEEEYGVTFKKSIFVEHKTSTNRVVDMYILEWKLRYGFLEGALLYTIKELFRKFYLYNPSVRDKKDDLPELLSCVMDMSSWGYPCKFISIQMKTTEGIETFSEGDFLITRLNREDRSKCELFILTAPQFQHRSKNINDL
jgi:hypothetical protein